MDGYLTFLISIWYHVKTKYNKDYAHISQLKRYFKGKTQLYKFFDFLVNQGYAEQYSEEIVETNTLLKPTETGLTKFLTFYESRLKEILESGPDTEEKLDIEISRLKKTCKIIKKLQSLISSDPRV